MKDLVDAGAQHVFAFYLEDHVDEKLTINGVEKRALHKVAHTNLEANQELWSFALLASEQVKFSVIDTMRVRDSRSTRQCVGWIDYVV